MAFTRKALAGLGLEKEQIEKVMALHGTSMSGFIPKSQLQARIGAAVEHALQTAPVPDIAESEEYKRLQSDFNAYRRRSESLEILRKAGVKEKFLEAVLALLDCEKPVPGQLSAIRRQYEEYFITGFLSGEDAHFHTAAGSGATAKFPASNRSGGRGDRVFRGNSPGYPSSRPRPAPGSDSLKGDFPAGTASRGISAGKPPRNSTTFYLRG